MSRHSEALAALLTREPLPCIEAAAAEHPATVLCVGGAVRDALLRRPPADVDIAVAGDLDAFVERFADRCGRRPVAIGDPVRDTRRTRLGGVQVDVGGMLGAVPEDLAARDFTINAMAVRVGGRPSGQPELIDECGGVDDLERRWIRRVSEAALAQDPLRVLRAVRYYAVLDGFRIEAKTMAAIAAQATTISAAAAERVQAEWAELLAAPRWAAAARLAFDLDIGARTLGWMSTCAHADRWSRAEGNAAGRPSREDAVVLRLASLIAGPPAVPADRARDALVERRWPRRLAEEATRVADWATTLGEEDADTVGWSLCDPVAAARAARLAAVIFGEDDRRVAGRIDGLRRQAARAADERWVTGRDLRSWGLAEGPELGALLAQAARGQVERRWQDADAARRWARRRAVDSGAGKPR